MESHQSAVEVVVTVIHHGRKILLVFNAQWGAFTLPMTKLRQWPYGEYEELDKTEDEYDAAMRNAGEVLGKTSTRGPKLLLDNHVVEIQQSDRDSKKKRYAFRLFAFPVDAPDLAPGVLGEWLDVSEILDNERRPISKTARSLICKLNDHAKSNGIPFPPR